MLSQKPLPSDTRSAGELQPRATVTVGSLRFALTAAGHFNIPAVRATPLFDLDGAAVCATREGKDSYLLIDHRRTSSQREVARIELWDSAAPGDADHTVLLVICDASVPVEHVTAAPGLRAVVFTLRERGPAR